MAEDIRDKPYLTHKDVLGLNFIKTSRSYIYRRHYREGLRSHIMTVLNPADVENEKKGIVIDGFRWYPRAEPVKMLRIFRTRFRDLDQAEQELRRVRMLATYLAPDHVARSQEFLVGYMMHGKCEPLLCGLQEYVKGEMLEPWGFLDKDHLVSLLSDVGVEKDKNSAFATDLWIRRVRKEAENFIEKVKQMITETNHVPDLAGVGNLILTQSGAIKLVDINNISEVSSDPIIRVDDRGYPVCDKSIEALSLLEQKLAGRAPHRDNPIYKIFLDPERMNDVRALEKKWHLAMKTEIF
jgi:hypothetical protein